MKKNGGPSRKTSSGSGSGSDSDSEIRRGIDSLRISNGEAASARRRSFSRSSSDSDSGLNVNGRSIMLRPRGRPLSPRTRAVLEAQGIPDPDAPHHPNMRVRTGARCYVPPARNAPLAPLAPLAPPVPPVAAAARLHLRPINRTPAEQLRVEKLQKKYDKKRRMREQEAEGMREIWCAPSGVLLPNTPDFRFWGQYSGEVVLALPPGRMESYAKSCYLTVDEIEKELEGIYCTDPLPPLPTAILAGPRFVEDDFGSGTIHGFTVQEEEAGGRCNEDIRRIYRTFMTYCESGIDSMWGSRSLERMRLGREERERLYEEKMFSRKPVILPEVLYMTFRDIEEFVRIPPEQRNLATFVNERRQVWLKRSEDAGFSAVYLRKRRDLSYDYDNPEDMQLLDEIYDSEGGTDISFETSSSSSNGGGCAAASDSSRSDSSDGSDGGGAAVAFGSPRSDSSDGSDGGGAAVAFGSPRSAGSGGGGPAVAFGSPRSAGSGGDSMNGDGSFGGKRRKSTMKRNARSASSKLTRAGRKRSLRKYKKTTKRTGKKKLRYTRRR